jgi:hypothetical protein
MKNPYSLKNILLSEGILKEDTRFDFQKGGGGGKRFIPTNGIVPSRIFTVLPNHFKMLGDQLLISPEAVIALTSVERGRGGAVNYKELYGKLKGYFDIKKANSSSEFGPAQTSSFLSQFKQGLKGRLESTISGGKEFKVWNGEGSKNEKGDFVFPLAQFKSIEEGTLKNLVGAAALTAASLLSPKAQAQQVPNAAQQKTWQQMSQGEKGAKKQELIKKGGIEAFNAYKDSIGTDARGRADAVLNKAAADAGMSPEKYIKFLQKRNSGDDAGLSGLMIGGSSTKSGKGGSAPKAPCKGGSCPGLNTKS